jgi:hypothetical protein
MKIAERAATWRRGRRVLLRVSRAAWRLEQAERERSWALAWRAPFRKLDAVAMLMARLLPAPLEGPPQLTTAFTTWIRGWTCIGTKTRD